MKKEKILLLVAILLSIGLIAFLYIYFVEGDRFFPRSRIEHATIDSKFNLSDSDTPLVGCLINVIEDKSWCYNTQGREFLETDVLDTYLNIKSLENGFHLLTPKGDKLELYKVNSKEILTSWYEEIDNDESIFFREIEEIIDVDIYSLTQFRIIQKRIGDITDENIKEEYTTLRRSPYVPMNPMKYSDYEYICKLVPTDCKYWEGFRVLPSKLIQEANKQEWDYGDIDLTHSRITFLSIGLESYGVDRKVSTEETKEYEKFEKGFSDYYGGVSREEILFIGRYTPLNLVTNWKGLYDGWSGEYSEHYYYFIDKYCKEAMCKNIKLNILYDEYEK